MSRQQAMNSVQVRMIIRQGKAFVCGMCRNKFGSMHAVAQCFDRCISKLLNQPLVVEIKAKAGVYVCILCERHHSSKAAAILCAKECRHQILLYKDLAKRKAGKQELPPRKPPLPRFNQAQAAAIMQAWPTGESSETKVVRLRLAEGRQEVNDPAAEFDDEDDSFELGVASKAG